jgi:hypothetical protein
VKTNINFRLELCLVESSKPSNTMGEAAVPVMVAISHSISKPKFTCILVDKGKSLSTLYQEFSTLSDNNNGPCLNGPSAKVSTSEAGNTIPFHQRITVDQAFKMLRSDILWINFEFPPQEKVPPPNVKNAFEVLKFAQITKTSLPEKYPRPINGTFELFNKIVDLCRETKVFFR